MRFSAEWQDPGVSASAELRATFCLLDIEVDGKQVSRFFDERYVRAHDRIAMSAYPPAQGLARFWWSLIAGRSGRILLRRIRDGFVLPDVRFEPDGRYVDITVEPFEYDNPPVTFPRAAKERSRVDELERNISQFIESVVEKLSDSKVRNTWLEERWSHIQASFEDDEERLFCEAAGALGIDPYACDEAEARSIESAGEYFEADALHEFLASQRARQATDALRWLQGAEQRVGDRATLPDIASIKRSLRQGEVAPAPMPEYPWELGYAVAAECRKNIGLQPERVFGDVVDVAALFGGRRFEVAPGRAPGLRAEVYDGQHEPKVILAELPIAQSRTFAMMRAIGDFFAFEQAGRAPITDTYSYRQAVGRAFAVEMLAPAQTILQMERDGMSVDEIAAARKVSEEAITRHLENHRAVPAA